ncbi:hypothetical protein Dimus_005559 [Dionaea muscipula]
MSSVPSTAGDDGGSGVVLQRDGGASGDGFNGDSPKMVVDVVMDGLGPSPMVGGVVVHGLDGADAPVSALPWWLVGGPTFCLLPVKSNAHGVSSNSTAPVIVSMNVVVPATVPTTGHVSSPIPAGRSTSTRLAEAAAKPDVGRGKAGPSRSYAAVTVCDMKSDVKLSFVPPVNSNGRKHVFLCGSDCSVNDYHFSLVGHFIDGSMQFTVVRSLAFRLRKSAGLFDVRTLDNGFFVFIFASIKARDDVLEPGPWFFFA